MARRSRRPSSGTRPEDEESGQQWLYGMQPVLEALRQRSKGIEKIWIAYGRSGPGTRQILSLARADKIPVSFRDRASLDSKAGTSKHQGVLALFAAVTPVDFEAFWQGLPYGSKRFLALLDEVQDPHNLGAILRTACAAGLEGILLPRHRTSPVSPAVVKASAGAVHSVRLVRVGSAVRTLEALRENGVFVVGAAPKGEKEIYDIDLCQNVCIAIGGEGQGLRPALERLCDILVAIPMVGPIQSLNASVAAGVLFYEVVRQRRAKKTDAPSRNSLSPPGRGKGDGTWRSRFPSS